MTSNPAYGTPPSAPEQRVSSLAGDRLCTTCFYNLKHQPVIREPYYGLLLIRCPECGTASGIEDHPALGRWPRRGGTVMAIGWYTFMLALALSVGLNLFVYSSSAGFIATEDVMYDIQQLHETTNPSAQAQMWGSGIDQWWSTVDKEAFIRDQGGYWQLINPYTPLIWIPFGILALLLGSFWGVALSQSGRRAKLIWTGAVFIFAGLFAASLLRHWLVDPISWYHQAAAQLVGPQMLIMTLSILAIAFITGLLTGPRLGNWALRRSLPEGWLVSG